MGLRVCRLQARLFKQWIFRFRCDRCMGLVAITVAVDSLEIWCLLVDWGWSKQVYCPTTGDWRSHCFSINHFMYSSESAISIQSEDVVVNLPVHVEGLARGSFFDLPLHITTIFFGGSREVPVPTLQSPVHWHTRDGPRIVYFSSIGHLIPLLLTTVYRAHGPWHSILATHCHTM